MNRLLILICATAAIVAPAQETKRLTASKANEYGIVYTLPTTALDITIEAEFTTRTPGEFNKYAAKYLNATPITEPSTSVGIKSITINTSGVANPDERYLVTIKGGDGAFLILSDNNVPLAMNTERTLNVATTPIPVSTPASPSPLETPAARQVITQEMLQSHSSAKRAELAAELIYSLRQSRTDIITGQSDQMPPDGAAMQLVLDNINAQEQALIAMFLGTTTTRTEVRTVQIVPDGEVTNQIIARISVSQGIVDPSDLSGQPVYLSLQSTEEGTLPVNDKGERLPFPKDGVAYNIPGKADVTISYDGRIVAQKSVAMAQFGVVYGLNPSNFADKKAPIYLIFDPATGGAADIGIKK